MTGSLAAMAIRPLDYNNLFGTGSYVKGNPQWAPQPKPKPLPMPAGSFLAGIQPGISSRGFGRIIHTSSAVDLEFSRAGPTIHQQSFADLLSAPAAANETIARLLERYREQWK